MANAKTYRGSISCFWQETLVEEHLKQEFVDIPVITEEVRLGETRVRVGKTE